MLQPIYALPALNIAAPCHLGAEEVFRVYFRPKPPAIGRLSRIYAVAGERLIERIPNTRAPHLSSWSAPDAEEVPAVLEVIRAARRAA